MSVLKGFVKVICVAGGVVIVVIVIVKVCKHYGVVERLKKAWRKFDGTDTEKSERENASSTSQPKQRLSFDRDKAKDEFVRKSFKNIYEPIYRVSQGISAKSNDILDDLNTRMLYLDGYPNVQAFWRSLFADYKSFTPEKLRETTAEFMNFVFEAGIKRDNSDRVTVDETTRRKYYNYNDGEFVTGETMKVKFAYWSLGDEILEKGTLTSL